MLGETEGRYRVLLVDPTGDLERRLEPGLSDAGFDSRTVGTAAACLGDVERGGIDGVVSAYALPDLDGIRLLRSLRVSHPDLPFVLVPEEGSEALAGEAIAAGVSGYVPRDGDPATVVSRLRDSLQRGDSGGGAESHRRYRQLVEISPAPINLFDENGESIWCNDAALDLLGLDGRDELVGHSIFEFIHPGDHDIAREEIREVIEAKKSVGPTQMKLRDRTGGTRYVQVSTAVGSFLGKNIGQAVIVDVTELRETQDKLREERRFLEATLDTLQDVFYVVDPEGAFLRWNDATSEVTGYDDAELESMALDDLFAEECRASVRDSLRRVLETGRDTVEAKLVTKQGHALRYELRGRRLRTGKGAGGGDRRVVGIGRDVSERKERIRQLKVLERWLRHNIRNEITVVHGIAEMIENGTVSDVRGAAARIREHAGRLAEQADRERQLVDLLANPPEPEPIEITGVIDRKVGALRERYPDADVDVSTPREVHVRTIPGFGEAIGELAENAITHSDTGSPTVRIEVRADDPEYVSVSVLDDGPGIPAEERDVLFFESDIDQLHHGTGLGLLFVYWVVRVSGGDLEFGENEPRGNVVTLRFPSATGATDRS